jgi:membrane-bound ClpP family serine protease
MGQIIFSRHPIGTVGVGLFVVGIGAFVFSIIDPLFGPLALACIVAGGVCAVALARRRPKVQHIDPRDASNAEKPPRPIEPR